jgi:tetratricopeptide (TPR) repeat protein
VSDACRSPHLLDFYAEYLDHQDAVRFVGRVSKFYVQGTLERLADHASPPVRRAAVLALGFIGDYEANHVLGRALQDEDRTVRMLSENGIRSVWLRGGTEDQRRQLNVIVRLNSAQHYDEAIRRATGLLRTAGGFAEAWNQRAIAHFALGHYSESIRDCHQALELNPYHFAAAAGMGHAYLKLGNQVSALECFRRALGLNPDLEAVRVQVARLSRLIEEKGA